MYVQVKDMYICIKKGKSTWFLAFKIWALAVLKFFDVVLKFELPNAGVLNFPQNSAPSLIGPVFIIGDCVYIWRYFASIVCCIKVRLRDNHNNGYVVKTVRIRKKQTFVLISLLFRDFGQVTNLNLTVICEMYQGMENPTSY